MTHTHLTPPSRGLQQGLRRRLMPLVALLLATIALIGGVVAAPTPAEAAATPGAGGYWTPAGGWLGNYIVGNQRVYCIDLLTDTVGSGGAGTLAKAITEGGHGTRPVSGAELRKINYAVSVWGQTSDPILAAAVSAYVYNFTSANHYGRGTQYITGPHSTAILAQYRRVEADTNANFDQGTGSGTGTMQLDIDPSNHYLGTLRVTGLTPANAQGTVTLINGVFADTGLATRDGVTNNSAYPVIGVPPSDGAKYRVQAEGAFRGQGKRVYDSSVTIYAEGSLQRTAGPGQNRPGVVNFSLSAQDASERTSQFRPVVTTQVASKFVAQGEEFSDVLSFATTADSTGLHNPWYRDADRGYAQITAVGTLFGPFLAQPQEAEQPPANAPVAAQGVEVVTSAEHGPDIDYTVPSGATADEAGFYTWVWSIQAEHQQTSTQAFLPEGYEFLDRFGQVTETSITPTNLHISTAVTQTEAGVGQSIADEVTVQVTDGGWLQVDGARVPATLTGVAYFTETAPELADSAPADAEVVGNLTLTVAGPGSAMSEPLKLPFQEGYVTFQWCLLEREQPDELRGLLRETCDLYGQASETVQVIAPTVVTEAVPIVTVHDELTDTAIVSGQVAQHMYLEFALYKQPEVGDPKRSDDEVSTESRWSQEQIDELAGAAHCAPDNLVVTTERIIVEAGAYDAARYPSPAVRVAHEGTYWWVERLIYVDPDSGRETVVTSGECGLPNETTEVSKPTVSTQAVATATPGAEVFDTAEVTGPLPGAASGLRAELTFEVFQNTDGVDSCVLPNRVHYLDQPVPVNGSGSYQSASVRFDEAGEYFWVETLAYVDGHGNREVVHVGKCAVPSETTRVLADLPSTGSSAQSIPWLIWVAAVIAAGGAALLVAAQVRRYRSARH